MCSVNSLLQYHYVEKAEKLQIYIIGNQENQILGSDFFVTQLKTRKLCLQFKSRQISYERGYLQCLRHFIISSYSTQTVKFKTQKWLL